MKTDLYTKIILTIIAIALTVHVIKDLNLITPAQALPVAIPPVMSTQAVKEVIDVNIVRIDGDRIYGYTGMPVKVTNLK